MRLAQVKEGPSRVDGCSSFSTGAWVIRHDPIMYYYFFLEAHEVRFKPLDKQTTPKGAVRIPFATALPEKLYFASSSPVDP